MPTARASASRRASPAWAEPRGRRPRPLRFLGGELDKLGLADLYIVHYGDEVLLHDLRRFWHQALILNRPDRPREDLGKDVASGLADLETYGQMTLAIRTSSTALRLAVRSTRPTGPPTSAATQRVMRWDTPTTRACTTDLWPPTAAARSHPPAPLAVGGWLHLACVQRR